MRKVNLIRLYRYELYACNKTFLFLLESLGSIELSLKLLDDRNVMGSLIMTCLEIVLTLGATMKNLYLVH